jgi:hypothetical protein
MELQEEILTALRDAAIREGPLVDPRIGRTWQTGLQRLLNCQVTDATQYPSARSYQFECAVTPVEGRTWRSTLRVLISGVGPFATQTFIVGYGQERWWAGSVRVTRTGLSEEDAAAMVKLRAWYPANHLTEVEPAIQAEQVPAEVPLRRTKDGQLSLFQALFKGTV